MAIDFPNSPSSGDIHTVSGKQWQWDGEKWIAYGATLAPDVLKVDSGNNRVGINQTSPTVALDVTGSARITGDLTVSGTTVTVDSASVLVKDRVQFEGATANDYETILVATDPTADRTITLPDATGTVATTTNLSSYLPLAGGTLTGAVTGTDATFTGTTTTYVDVVQETGTSHTFVATDAGKYIHCTTPSANCTITLPADNTYGFNFPVGTQMLFSSPHSSNKVVFAAASGAAVTSLDDKLTLKGPDGVAAVIKWTTNSWLLFGALE